MSICDIICRCDGGVYELVKPNCPTNAPAYEKWKGLVVRKVLGAIIVVDPAGTNYSVGDFLNLSGMVTSSKWREQDAI